MQASFFLILSLVTFVSASQPESVPVQVQPQNVQVVGNSPVVGPSGVEVGHEQVQPSGVVGEPHHSQVHGASYYAPAGMITVVGEQGALKPGSQVRNFEQYGQPESASLPANYKPFGSWGLYIGGNPADGYYTNYYKALSNSVDKQQAGEPAKPFSGSQTAAFSPYLKQAGSSPYGGGDYYPFAYSPSDLSSASRVNVEPAHTVVHSAGHVSPVAHSQVYGVQPQTGAVETGYGAPMLSYADHYATKKLGAAYAQKEATKEVPMSPSKGYQSRMYVYPTVMSAPVMPMASPSMVGQQQASGQQQSHHHVVAYPVPVGSQIVGSQPGVEGAYGPYGVHAFTRYAVKPTVVSHEPSYYYSVQQPSTLQQPQQPQLQQYQPTYKQVVHSSQSVSSGQAYPLSFYGFPLSQLNSVQPQHQQVGGQVVPVHSSVDGPVQHGSVPVVHQPSLVEPAASEKSERTSEEKPAQKRA